MARGEIVAYLNSDDLYLPGTLKKVVSVFEANPETDFVYGDFHAIAEDGALLTKSRTIPFDASILLYDANFICQPASFYRRRLLDHIGLFDEKMRYLMDYEFFLRAARQRAIFQLVPDYLAAIRFHRGCKTLSAGLRPWGPERQEVLARYQPRDISPGARRSLALTYRLKRYFKRLGRGQLDFMDLRLAMKLRQLSHADNN